MEELSTLPGCNQIEVMGETDAHRLCVLHLDEADMRAGGVPVSELKVLIASHPDVLSILPDLNMLSLSLRLHGTDRPLASEARVRGGQTVHLLSTKDRTPEAEAAAVPDDEFRGGTKVFYAMDLTMTPDGKEDPTRFLTVPYPEKLAPYAVATLGLDETRYVYWCAMRNGRMVLKRAPRQVPNVSIPIAPQVVHNAARVINNNNARASQEQWHFHPDTPKGYKLTTGGAMPLPTSKEGEQQRRVQDAIATSNAALARLPAPAPPIIVQPASVTVEEALAKFRAEHEATIYLPSRDAFPYTLASTKGDKPADVLDTLCELFKLGSPKHYVLHYHHSKLPAGIVVPNVPYDMIRLPQ